MSGYYPYPYGQGVYPFGIIAEASNVRGVGAENPPYTSSDFLGFYPQFTDLVDPDVLTQIIEKANLQVNSVRWGDNWIFGMHDLVAHYVISYLQKSGGSSPTAGSVTAAGAAYGLASSKSVGDVSVSYDYGVSSSDYAGYGDLAMTSYGRAFITQAMQYGKGGMGIW